MKRISLKGKKVKYEVRRSRRAKHISLTARADGSFVLILPPGVSEISGTKFLREKRQWMINALQFVRRFRWRGIRTALGRRAYLRYKERALGLAERRLSYFNRYYGLLYGKVNVKDHRGQWGSCSSKKNLNFNYRIALLPAHLADYVILHELCHIKHFNHSRLFWNLIGEMMPDYEVREAELRKYLILS